VPWAPCQGQRCRPPPPAGRNRQGRASPGRGHQGQRRHHRHQAPPTIHDISQDLKLQDVGGRPRGHEATRPRSATMTWLPWRADITRNGPTDAVARRRRCCHSEGPVRVRSAEAEIGPPPPRHRNCPINDSGLTIPVRRGMSEYLDLGIDASLASRRSCSARVGTSVRTQRETTVRGTRPTSAPKFPRA
jgi:hypothetical protein